MGAIGRNLSVKAMCLVLGAGCADDIGDLEWNGATEPNGASGVANTTSGGMGTTGSADPGTGGAEPLAGGRNTAAGGRNTAAGGRNTAAGGQTTAAGASGDSSGGAAAQAGQQGSGGRGSAGRVDLGTGGTSARAGATSAAGTSNAGGAGAGGASNSADGTCSVLLNGATGSEPQREIPTCCLPTSSEKAFVQQVFQLLNEYRLSLGLSALAFDDALAAGIQGHSVHQALHPFKLAHEAPEDVVRSFDIRSAACGGQRPVGENIAWNYRTPQLVMDGWKNSPGHDSNMRGAKHRRVGIGYHLSANREHWWGQVFGR